MCFQIDPLRFAPEREPDKEKSKLFSQIVSETPAFKEQSCPCILMVISSKINSIFNLNEKVLPLTMIL